MFKLITSCNGKHIVKWALSFPVGEESVQFFWSSWQNLRTEPSYLLAVFPEGYYWSCCCQCHTWPLLWELLGLRMNNSSSSGKLLGLTLWMLSVLWPNPFLPHLLGSTKPTSVHLWPVGRASWWALSVLSSWSIHPVFLPLFPLPCTVHGMWDWVITPANHLSLQNPCPEAGASFPSKAMFWWVSG